MFSQTILVGRLGQDPEVRYTGSGTAVATLNLATERSYKDNDGEWVKESNWHRIVVWGKRAETVGEYLGKGSLVMIVGDNRTRSWEDKEGNKKYTTEVVASVVQFLDKKSDRNEDEPAPRQTKKNTSSNAKRTASGRKTQDENDFLDESPSEKYQATDDDVAF